MDLPSSAIFGGAWGRGQLCDLAAYLAIKKATMLARAILRAARPQVRNVRALSAVPEAQELSLKETLVELIPEKQAELKVRGRVFRQRAPRPRKSLCTKSRPRASVADRP